MLLHPGIFRIDIFKPGIDTPKIFRPDASGQISGGQYLS
jgi:hypothetical protein